MIRVPAVLVGLMCAYGLSAVAFMLAMIVGDGRALIVLLPVIASIGGFIDGRWSVQPSPVPGLAIGILILAARLGLGLGMHDNLLQYIDPIVAMLELIAAVTGGLMGTVVTRRLTQQHAPKAGYNAL